MRNIKLNLILLFGFSTFIIGNFAIEFKGLNYVYQILNGDFLLDGDSIKSSNPQNNHDDDDDQDQDQDHAATTSTSDSTNNESTFNALMNKYNLHTAVNRFHFIDYISYMERRQCFPSDFVEYLQETYNFFGGGGGGGGGEDGERGGRLKRSQIKVQCISKRVNGTLELITTMKDVMSVLIPYGNVTKINQPGYCAVILFYTKTCPASANIAPHYNALAKQFPDIRIAALDSYRFYTLNTEFGIIALPSVLLFHQGRPVVKLNDTQPTITSLIKFITKHTSIEAINPNAYVTSEDFMGPLPNKAEKYTDYTLYMAWLFIILCSCYYFTKSQLYTQFIEMIKRNWQESEESHQQQQQPPQQR